MPVHKLDWAVWNRVTVREDWDKISCNKGLCLFLQRALTSLYTVQCQSISGLGCYKSSLTDKKICLYLPFDYERRHFNNQHLSACLMYKWCFIMLHCSYLCPTACLLTNSRDYLICREIVAFFVLVGKNSCWSSIITVGFQLGWLSWGSTRKRVQTKNYFRAKFRNKRTGVAGVRGPRDIHQVGGTGPQGCEPSADAGAVAAKMLKILVFVRYTGKNKSWSAASGFLLPPSAFDLCNEPVHLPVLSQHLCPSPLCHGHLQIHQEKSMKSAAGMCRGLAGGFSTLSK